MLRLKLEKVEENNVKSIVEMEIESELGDRIHPKHPVINNFMVTVTDSKGVRKMPIDNHHHEHGDISLVKVVVSKYRRMQ